MELGQIADRIFIQITRGTVRAVVDRPRTRAEKRRLDRLVEEHFGPPEPASALVTRHQVDEILLIARWFRLNPDEIEEPYEGAGYCVCQTCQVTVPLLETAADEIDRLRATTTED